MFSNCSSLTSLDVTPFQYSEGKGYVTICSSSCSSLTFLDVTHFNTANVTNMQHNVDNCSKLTSLDLTNFNTANVTNMGTVCSETAELSPPSTPAVSL